MLSPSCPTLAVQDEDPSPQRIGAASLLGLLQAAAALEQEPSPRSERQRLEAALDVSSGRSPLGSSDLLLGESTRLRSGPGSGRAPGQNPLALHEACADRVNSRVAQEGNLGNCSQIETGKQSGSGAEGAGAELGRDAIETCLGNSISAPNHPRRQSRPQGCSGPRDAQAVTRHKQRLQWRHLGLGCWDVPPPSSAQLGLTAPASEIRVYMIYT